MKSLYIGLAKFFIVVGLIFTVFILYPTYTASIFLLCIISSFGFAAIWSKNFRDIQKHGEKTVGEILMVNEKILDPNAGPHTHAKDFKIKFSYQGNNGKTYTKVEKFSANIGEVHHVGEFIDVSYKKNNPRIAFSDRKIGEILFYQMR